MVIYRFILFLLFAFPLNFIFALNSFAKITFYTENVTPYAFYQQGEVKGIYKEYLDQLSNDIDFQFELIILNSYDLYLATLSNKNIAYIGLTPLHPNFKNLKHTQEIGSISLRMNSLQKIQQNENVNIGALRGIGFEFYAKQYDLEFYDYASMGLFKLINYELDAIIEDPLVLICPDPSLLDFIQLPEIIYVDRFELFKLNTFISFSTLSMNHKKLVEQINRKIKQGFTIKQYQDDHLSDCKEIISLEFYDQK